MRLLANAEIYSVASSLDTLNGSVTVSAPLSAMTMSLRGLSRESVLCSYHSFDNLAKDDMSTIEPRCLLNCDKELRPVGILASIGHGQPSSAIMLQFEVFIRKAISIDAAT
ncbi:hypothetical protein ALC56_00064 [Trachymyrmex septentrionalis]|uniref:Uncharacterized protein n=1 Tax=Trachymyrmex septentrionalis TaxID=34720 RepID=A0A151K3P0_9HYME|nr:hypothetical protein ALC56_03389 [Trachymyrmex septentrionalis]KYN50687.1 hypothetical protein ALC56_00064 [Trachymyrmex septentrionalis]